MIDTPVAKGGYVAPVLVEASAEVGNIELNASTDFTVRSVDVTYEGALVVTGSVTFGAHKLDAGAAPFIDGRMRLDAPDPLYGFRVSLPL